MDSLKAARANVELYGVQKAAVLTHRNARNHGGRDAWAVALWCARFNFRREARELVNNRQRMERELVDTARGRRPYPYRGESEAEEQARLEAES